jgi:hypothetical protein
MLSLFHPLIGTGRQDFTTYLTILPPSLTQGKTRASNQTHPGASTNE